MKKLAATELGQAFIMLFFFFCLRVQPIGTHRMQQENGRHIRHQASLISEKRRAIS
ncbi:hypothetical protein [Desulfobulbus alkaliphilus]|uniref:hypothetical protein n=1 Tax=Desulfobulbus alkaliphilus TaxID=869814 RepID=UPI001966AAF4|nr:hypothetical protein [Desulfobulbus alkaliphilus]MBM9535771.1 hypothetical protein [Desulfobulbus alkaliphilus]